jgi:hypothetical protein
VSQGDVTELGTTSSFTGCLPEMWLAMFGGLNHICDGGSQELSGILGDFNIDHLTIDGTGYEDDSTLMACYKNSAVGNFFNFDSKIHSHSVPQLTLLS